MEDYPSGSNSDKVAYWLIKKTHHIQSRWAKWMDRLFNHQNKKTQKAVWLVALMLMFAYSGIIIFFSLRRAKAVTMQLPASIHKPLLQPFPERNLEESRDKIPASILSFKFYIDSLDSSKQGKQRSDSIRNARPGLVDSMELLYNIYCN